MEHGGAAGMVQDAEAVACCGAGLVAEEGREGFRGLSEGVVGAEELQVDHEVACCEVGRGARHG